MNAMKETRIKLINHPAVANALGIARAPVPTIKLNKKTRPTFKKYKIFNCQLNGIKIFILHPMNYIIINYTVGSKKFILKPPAALQSNTITHIISISTVES